MRKYFKIILLSILLLLSTSDCATNNFFRTTPSHTGVDSKLAPYVQSFIDKSSETVTKKDLLGLTIGFKEFEFDSSVVGLCYSTPFFREIDINIDWWEEHEDPLEREELMFHELGHCVLYRGHTTPTSMYGVIGWFESLLFELGVLKEKTRLPDGCPPSYMHPNTIGSFCIDRHYNYYMKELYEKRNDTVEFQENRVYIRSGANERR